jgi:hypothetical protein
MGNCKPEAAQNVFGRIVYFWTIPMNCHD